MQDSHANKLAQKFMSYCVLCRVVFGRTLQVYIPIAGHICRLNKSSRHTSVPALLFDYILTDYLLYTSLCAAMAANTSVEANIMETDYKCIDSANYIHMFV